MLRLPVDSVAQTVMRASPIERVVVGSGTKLKCGGSLKLGVLYASDRGKGGANIFFEVYRGSLSVCARLNFEDEARLIAAGVKGFVGQEFQENAMCDLANISGGLSSVISSISASL